MIIANSRNVFEFPVLGPPDFFADLLSGFPFCFCRRSGMPLQQCSTHERKMTFRALAADGFKTRVFNSATWNNVVFQFTCWGAPLQAFAFRAS